MQLRFTPMEIDLDSSTLIDAYEVWPYEVKIFEPKLNQSPEPLYIIRAKIDFPQQKMIVKKIACIIKNHGDTGNLFPNFQELMKIRFDEATKLLKLRYSSLSETEIHKLAQLATYKSLRLIRIMPFLLDENVEEIFLDNPDASIYIDHRKWGRCRTSTRPSKNEISALKTRLRAESGLRLDNANPSLKTELLAEKFQARFSLDISPLALDGLHLDARKLRRKHFTIPELISNGTITSEAVAYLYFYMLRKRNITVIGEPGSGKTTLINALDLLTPSDWRKITIEDVIESISQTELGNHQTRFKVEPLESLNQESRTKTIEIIKLLHRAPDWIYLGEIQTAEHSQAMFHALTAGLKGLQTCHAASPEQAIIRWIIHHKVPAVCMFDLDMLIHVRKLHLLGKDVRRVSGICEIIPPTETLHLGVSDINLQYIFTWDPQSYSLKLTCNLNETPLFQKIKKLEPVNSVQFYEEINSYKKIFEYLVSEQIFDVEKNIETFHYLYATKTKLECRGSINWPILLDDVQRYIIGLNS